MRGRSLRQLRRTTAATADCHRCRRRLWPRHPHCRCQPHRQRRCHYLPTLQLSTCRPKLHHHLLFNGAYTPAAAVSATPPPPAANTAVSAYRQAVHTSACSLTACSPVFAPAAAYSTPTYAQLGCSRHSFCPLRNRRLHSPAAGGTRLPYLVPCLRLASSSLLRYRRSLGVIVANGRLRQLFGCGLLTDSARGSAAHVDRQRTAQQPAVWRRAVQGCAALQPSAAWRSSVARSSGGSTDAHSWQPSRALQTAMSAVLIPAFGIRCPPRTEIPHGWRLLRPALVACVDPSPPAASPNARFADPGRVALLWLPLALPPPPPPTG